MHVSAQLRGAARSTASCRPSASQVQLGSEEELGARRTWERGGLGSEERDDNAVDWMEKVSDQQYSG
jgi:hypothetical protein